MEAQISQGIKQESVSQAKFVMFVLLENSWTLFKWNHTHTHACTHSATQ